MLQRIQSLYLIAIILVNIIVLSFVPLWKIGENDYYFKQDTVLTLMIAMVCAAAMAALAQFKVRQRQVALNRLNLLINLAMLAMVLTFTFNPSMSWIDALTEAKVAMANGGFLPIATIVLLFLANKGIRKDEELIKSVDRIR